MCHSANAPLPLAYPPSLFSLLFTPLREGVGQYEPPRLGAWGKAPVAKSFPGH